MTQDEQQRVRRIKQYVLLRLREELATAPRGAQAQLAKKLGVSGAHLSNMLSTSPSRQPGEDFRRKVAALWGLTYAQLEAVALGEPPESSRHTSTLPPDELPPGLRAVLAGYSWMPELPVVLRSVVCEQARLHYTLGGLDLPRDEWQRVVTGLEREALALHGRRHASRPPESTSRERMRRKAMPRAR